MGSHRPRRASQYLASGTAVSRTSAGVLVAGLPAAPAQTAVEEAAGPPGRRARPTSGEGEVPAAPAVLIHIEPNGSDAIVSDRRGLQSRHRVAPPEAGQLRARTAEFMVDAAAKRVGVAVLAAAATALAEARPASSLRRGTTKARGRPQSAAA